MIPPTGQLNSQKREFHEVVFDMRHAVFSVIRERQVPGGKNARALGTGFFVGPTIFITCDHVVNNPQDPHQQGDSYVLVANLTGRSGRVYMISSPTLGNELTLFPNLDLAVLQVPAVPDQPYVSLEFGSVYEGQDIGVVGYPLASLRTVNGNVVLDQVLYRASRGCITGLYTANDGTALANVPFIEVNFLFVPGNSGGPVFSADTGKVFGYVRGFRSIKIRERVENATMIQQLPLGVAPQYIENLNAIYSLAIKLDFIRAAIGGFGVAL